MVAFRDHDWSQSLKKLAESFQNNAFLKQFGWIILLEPCFLKAMAGLRIMEDPSVFTQCLDVDLEYDTPGSCAAFVPIHHECRQTPQSLNAALVLLGNSSRVPNLAKPVEPVPDFTPDRVESQWLLGCRCSSISSSIYLFMSLCLYVSINNYISFCAYVFMYLCI